MATAKQIAANRLNAKKSTGPRTEAGKSMSRRNALKHGIDALSEVSHGEPPIDLQNVAVEYDREFQPRGIAERVLVDALIRKDWLMRRQAFLLADLTTYGTTVAFKTGEGNEYGAGYTLNVESNYRLHRHMMDTERNYWRYMAELEARQSARWRFQEEHPEEVCFPVTPSAQTPDPAIGFVSQTPSGEPNLPPNPTSPESPTQSPSPTPIRDDVSNQPGEIYCNLRVERS